MTRVYYKEAVGAFVVFDVTRGSTFEAVSKWKHDLDSKVKLANGSPIPSVLLANKCDQKKENSNSTSLMDNFCKETGFLGWFETSAKVSQTQVCTHNYTLTHIHTHSPTITYFTSTQSHLTCIITSTCTLACTQACGHTQTLKNTCCGLRLGLRFEWKKRLLFPI